VASHNFFISYCKTDTAWAEWIAWTLEEAKYSVVYQASDFRPGENVVLKTQRAAVEAQRTISLLSVLESLCPLAVLALTFQISEVGKRLAFSGYAPHFTHG
jgi:hypothetical protein